jgi:hypothetical protein
MAFYRKRPIVIQAIVWDKMGDHPEVKKLPFLKYLEIGLALGEKSNGITPDKLGWIETLEGGHIVSPGDYIITGQQGEVYPCKPDIFLQTYERVIPPDSKPPKKRRK